MGNHGPVRIAIVVACLALLVPYGELLVATWSGDSKSAAPSMLSLGGACFLVWRNRAALVDGPAPIGRAVVPGLVTLALAALGYAMAVVLDVRLGAGLGVVLLLASMCWLHAGSTALARMVTPLVLIGLAAPLPGFVEAELTRLLVGATVWVTPSLLAPLVGPIEVEGAVLSMVESGGSVAVVDDCSGLGGILLFAPLSVLVFALRGPGGGGGARWMAGAGFFAVAAALAFGASLARVWVSALLVHYESTWAHSDAVHEALGLVMLCGALAVLFVLRDRFVGRQDGDGSELAWTEGAA